ncbi:type II secretion system F family protein [Pseudidiomarina sediminum]|uniref:type II secretion system F family protein n=1 Tax=Pseudidiomarina sediminum TaxID=431675 RepID=UPI001C964561|nr:type II secretion system F family protein [Pseudidiomarina sediminum]MBY6065071.1 type II secretion system F family protein [Pseudidiomarina sediminum]
MMSHSWQFLLLGLLLLGVLWLVTSSVLQLVQPYCRHRVEALFEKLPSRIQRYLNGIARRHGGELEPLDFWTQTFLSLVAIAVCGVLPLPWWSKSLVAVLCLLYVVQQRGKLKLRLRTFERQWPASLDLLAMLLHAGLSFQASLQALTELESRAIPLLQLRWLYRQLQAGVSLDEALSEFAVRLPSPAVTSFNAAVLQARVTGGALADTLMAQASQGRIEQQLAAEKFAQEIGLKLLFPLVTCFFPVTFLLILGPIFIGFLTPEG